MYNRRTYVIVYIIVYVYVYDNVYIIVYVVCTLTYNRRSPVIVYVIIYIYVYVIVYVFCTLYIIQYVNVYVIRIRFCFAYVFVLPHHPFLVFFPLFPTILSNNKLLVTLLFWGNFLQKNFYHKSNKSRPSCVMKI